MRQAGLANYVRALDKAGPLTRVTEERRADGLPALMQANPDTAIYAEHAKDRAFPFLANGYGVRPMYALALECDGKRVGLEIARRSELRVKPEMVNTAPCKDVIIKGDIDLTMFPLARASGCPRSLACSTTGPTSTARSRPATRSGASSWDG